MKYRVDLFRHDSLTVDVFADDAEAAVKLAERDNAGFRVDGMVELLEGDQPGAEHQPAARCEACQKVIWMGEMCVGTGDGGDLCVKCANSAVASGGA